MTIPTDRMRDPGTFPPLPEFPHVTPELLSSWLDAAQVQPVSAIDWSWPPNWTVGPRKINDSMWFVLESGTAEGWVQDPSRLITLRAGDTMLIPAHETHMIRATGKSSPNVTAVHFYATVFGGINLLEMLGFPICISSKDKIGFGDASHRLAREYALKAPGWKPSMAAEIFTLLLRTLRTVPNSFDPQTETHGHVELRRVMPAVEWIDKNLSSSDIAVEQIAATVFLSPTHFRRIFRDVFGMSPICFVRKRRVERAGMLIRTTDKSLKEIAHECGFTDPTYFSKTFRKLMKKTPHAYRQANVV